MALGIDTLKQDIQFIADAIKQAEISLKDGFQYTDLFSFLGIFSQLDGVIKSFSQVTAEAKDLTADEISQLLAFISATFVFNNAKLQTDVTNAIAVVFAVLTFIKGLKAVAPVVVTPVAAKKA